MIQYAVVENNTNKIHYRFKSDNVPAISDFAPEIEWTDNILFTIREVDAELDLDVVVYDGENFLEDTDLQTAKTDQLKIDKRVERNTKIDAIEWRLNRYKWQLEDEVTPTDSSTVYAALLDYIQELRDFTTQNNWETLDVPDFVES